MFFKNIFRWSLGNSKWFKCLMTVKQNIKHDSWLASYFQKKMKIKTLDLKCIKVILDCTQLCEEFSVKRIKFSRLNLFCLQNVSRSIRWNDILQIWKKRKYSSQLLFIHFSCICGIWCERMKNVYSAFKKTEAVFN